VAKSAKTIGSDDHKAAVLVELAESSFQDEQLRDAFFTAVDGIGSDDERDGVVGHEHRARRKQRWSFA
jgi:hypothetical protein